MHKYKLTKQTTILCTNINCYKCVGCGKKKVEYEMFGSKIKLHPDFYKKQGKELLE